MVITDAELILRAIISVFLAGLIGLEREHLHKPAGLRTNILVGLGSTLFMLISMKLPVILGSQAIDPGRIAGQVVTGIGFIGAGAIIQARGSIVGMTTAATIWVVAAIGLAVGIGYYFAAFAITFITLAVLYVLRMIEKRPEQIIPEQEKKE